MNEDATDNAIDNAADGVTDGKPADKPAHASIDVPAPADMMLPDALRLAVEMHQNRQLEGAETLYRRILDAAPQHRLAGVWASDIGFITDVNRVSGG